MAIFGCQRHNYTVSLSASYLERAATEALDRGDGAGAEKLLREALAKDPDDYRCLVMIAHVLRENGNATESARFAEKGVSMKPNLVESYFQLGLSLLDLRRAEAAVAALSRAVALRPEIAEFHLTLGTALQTMGRMREAQDCFKQASRLEPADLRSRVSLATRLLAEDDAYGAASQIRTVLSRDPGSVHANLAMAEIAIVEGHGAAAEAHIRMALQKHPENAFALALLGLRLSQAGEFDNAEAAFRRSIALNPDQGFSYWGLAQSNRINRENDGFIRQMEQVRNRRGVSGQELGSLLFALGKTYEGLGEYGRAMSEYDLANETSYKARYGDREFDREEYRRRLAEIPERFPSGKQNLGNPSDCPIFVVGMIRSGTTLVEQILSRHSEIAGAGALRFWQRHADSAARMEEILGDPDRANRLTQAYLNQLRSAATGTRHVIDKLPGNFQRLGLLAELFPRAKFIHCVRNPIDNALSIHTTPNRSPSVGKAGVVFVYRQYREMMRRWQEALPTERILDVRYEQLVSDPEPMIRKIVSFCGLAWDEACLRPEAGAQDVLTGSVWQARQPIYRTSVDRWRRFEPWLDELNELLEE